GRSSPCPFTRRSTTTICRMCGKPFLTWPACPPVQGAFDEHPHLDVVVRAGEPPAARCARGRGRELLAQPPRAHADGIGSRGTTRRCGRCDRGNRTPQPGSLHEGVG